MTSLIVILLFVVGIVVGRLFRDQQTTRRNIDRLVSVAIFVLLFLLGISVGINEKIVADFSKIGYNAIVLTLGAVLGSLILAKIVYGLFFKQSPKTEELS
jgi:uncharacterized membrane protein YbjE (DUF340 family)